MKKIQVISLQTQLRYLKNVEGQLRNKLGSVESKMMLSNAVFLFSVGTNDYMSPFLTNSTLFQSYSPTQYIEMVIGNLTIVVRVRMDFSPSTFSSSLNPKLRVILIFSICEHPKLKFFAFLLNFGRRYIKEGEESLGF